MLYKQFLHYTEYEMLSLVNFRFRIETNFPYCYAHTRQYALLISGQKTADLHATTNDNILMI